MIKQILYLSIIINYLLVIYTSIIYGILTDNIFFNICRCNIFIFTLINILLLTMIKYYTVIKMIIE